MLIWKIYMLIHFVVLKLKLYSQNSIENSLSLGELYYLSNSYWIHKCFFITGTCNY